MVGAGARQEKNALGAAFVSKCVCVSHKCQGECRAQARGRGIDGTKISITLQGMMPVCCLALSRRVNSSDLHLGKIILAG